MKVNDKLYIFGLVLVIGLTATVYYFKTPWGKPGLSAEFAEKRLKEVLMDTSRRSWAKYQPDRILITTSETAKLPSPSCSRYTERKRS